MENKEKPTHPMFRIHSILVFVLCSLCYALVFFHRTAPAVLSKDMAPDFNVSTTSLTIFSSMFFWTYSLMQPFGGLLADIMDPAILVGCSAIIASIGSFICGKSKSLGLAVFGRFVVGFGCAPTYVPICKLLTRWYPLDWYAFFGGVVLAAGGCGGIVAQAPLAAFARAYSWRNAFVGIALIGITMGTLVLIFVRRDPKDFGYDEVNEESGMNISTASLSERFEQLLINFKTVVTKPIYYVLSVYSFMINGIYFNIVGLWGGPYIRDCFPFKDGDMLISLSISMIVGSIILPIISNFFKTRKWVLFSTAFIALIIGIVFWLYDTRMSFTIMFTLFLIWGMSTGSVASVTFATVRENYDSSVVSTAIGCLNIFTFIGGAVFQTITGWLLNGYTRIGTAYPHEGYKNSLWLPSVIYCCIAIFMPFLIQDNLTHKGKILEEEEEFNEL